MREIEKIQKVLIFLEKNYTKLISPQELEDVSNYSYRNIQRIFKSIFKENIGEYQKRLRLENGFKKLIYSNESILDISFSIGYESNHAFSKAFKRKYAITPKNARLNKKELFNNFISSSHLSPIDSEIVTLNPIEVYYKLIITNDYDNITINSLWDEIYEITENDNPLKYYGIIADQPLLSIKTKCRYEACFTKPNKSQYPYQSKTILGGTYVKYVHYGSYDTILDTYRLLYHDWLFHQKYEIEAKPIIEYYEACPINVNEEEKYITHILIPIK